MQIRTLNTAQLAAFIHSEGYKNLQNLPITPLRALSQCNNPCAEVEDILLLLAMENEDLLGYLGMLPDVIYLNGKPEKIAWMSCLWIAPKTRGKGIAKMLIEMAFNAWNQQVILTEFTAEAGKLYQKLGIFQDLGICEGLRVYDLAKWDSLLPMKFPKLQPFSFFLRLVSVVTKLFFHFFKAKNKDKSLLFIPITEIDAETNAFIEAKNTDFLFRRTSKELNWLTHFPWIKEGRVGAKVRRVLPVRKAVAQTHRTSSKQSDEEISKNYYFSYQSALFRQTWIQVKDKHTQQIVACFMLSLRECNLKVPYFFAENAHIEAVATWILEYLQSTSASILTTFQPELVAYFQGQKNINFRIKNTSKPYMIAQKFDLPQPFTFQIQDGDGDCAFT